MFRSRMPEGMTTKSDSQNAMNPSSFSVHSGRQAVVSDMGMIVPMQLLIVIARQSACSISLRKTCSKRNAFSTGWTGVSSLVPGICT